MPWLSETLGRLVPNLEGTYGVELLTGKKNILNLPFLRLKLRLFFFFRPMIVLAQTAVHEL